jgi:hypothetical protein
MTVQLRDATSINEGALCIVLFDVKLLSVWSHDPEALLIATKLYCFADLRPEFVWVVIESGIKEPR